MPACLPGRARACVPHTRSRRGRSDARLRLRDIGLVYGGASVGLMGILADAVLDGGGHVTSVLPRHFVRKEIAHDRLTELHLVDSMHERKALMADLADRFIALPGGLGTFEELLEILTWAQLGLHQKSYSVLNVDGYFDGLLASLDHAVEERFVRPQHRAMLMVERDVDRLLDQIDAYVPPRVEKWIDRATR